MKQLHYPLPIGRALQGKLVAFNGDVPVAGVAYSMTIIADDAMHLAARIDYLDAGAILSISAAAPGTGTIKIVPHSVEDAMLILKIEAMNPITAVDFVDVVETSLDEVGLVPAPGDDPDAPLGA